MPRSFALIPALLLAAGALPAAALSIDFEQYSDGQTIAAPITAFGGDTLLVSSFRGPDVATALDTTPDDAPLPFEPGRARDDGNVLVLSGGTGGRLTFLLGSTANSLSFDWIELDSGLTGGKLKLFLSQSGVVELGIPTGDGPIHHFSVFGTGPFNAFQLEWFGSIGFDNFSTQSIEAVPEPASAALLALGLVILANARRRPAR